MLPPPLAHRRTKSPPCPRKMSLPKAGTFHQSSSVSSDDDSPVLSVAHLSKRSTTHTSRSFASWLFEREAATDVIADFEQTFSGARGRRPSARRRSAREFEDSLLLKAEHRPVSPVDSGLGSSIGSPSEKNLSRTLEKALDLTSNKDSALGDSVSGSVAGASELQGWFNRCLVICSTGINAFSADANQPKPRKARSSELTIIRYPIPSTKKESQPPLGQWARRQIYKRIYAPLLQETRFAEFRDIVAGTRKNKNLRCLRDVEQALINQPVVSTIYPARKNSRSNHSQKTLAVTPAKYRSFGELTIQLVVDTYQHLSELEQRRATDRVYDNGYFLDLVQQVQQLAAHIGSSDTSVEDGNEPTADDEITVEGGLAESGNLAELVRWKNGEGISLRTGLPYVPLAGSKRTAEEMGANAQLSARRKKGVEYPVQHLHCGLEGCDKVFSRKCDLSKHEKTHSRPFKCSVKDCKYADLGLPTEKELDRHMNDKHNSTAKMYKCLYCEFSTKRESNCKQHMEKKHNWTYQRSKGKDKAVDLSTTSRSNEAASGYASVLPSPASNAMSYDGESTPRSSVQPSPFTAPAQEFDFNNMNNQLPYQYSLFAPRGSVAGPSAPLQLDTAFSDNGMASAYPTPFSPMRQSFATPRTPAYSNITPSPAMTNAHHVVYNQNGQAEMPTPDLSDSAITPDTSMNGITDFNAMDTSMMLGDDFFATMPDADFTMMSTHNPAFTNPDAANATLFPNSMDSADFNFGNYTEDKFAAYNDNFFGDVDFTQN